MSIKKMKLRHLTVLQSPVARSKGELIHNSRHRQPQKQSQISLLTVVFRAYIY